MFKKMQGQKHQPGKPGAQVSPRNPTLPGVARGAMGSMATKGFKGRNAGAGASKELETMASPIFKAFMAQQAGMTPMTDSLRGR